MREEPAAHDPATLRRMELEQEQRPRIERHRSSPGARLPEVDLGQFRSGREEAEPLEVSDADPVAHQPVLATKAA